MVCVCPTLLFFSPFFKKVVVYPYLGDGCRVSPGVEGSGRRRSRWGCAGGQGCHRLPLLPEPNCWSDEQPVLAGRIALEVKGFSLRNC